MLLDTLGRRSRFVRTRLGRRLGLTDRDAEILSWLHRYRFLTTVQLTNLIRPVSRKRFVERLGDLFHEAGLIGRPVLHASVFNARSMPMLHEVTEAGIDWLHSLGRLPPRAVTFSRRSRARSLAQLPHTLLVIETLLAIETETAGTPDRRFVPVDEILARAPTATRRATNPLAIRVNPSGFSMPGSSAANICVIPDALYGIEYVISGEKRYRFWALECERTSPVWRSASDTSSTRRKVATYKALIAAGRHTQHWGIPNLEMKITRAS